MSLLLVEAALMACGSDAVCSWEQTILKADQLARSCAYAPALTELASALRTAESLATPDRRVELSLRRMGVVYCELGKYREAESCFLRSLKALDQMSPNTNERSTVLEGIEKVHRQTGEFAKAESFGRMALALREEAAGSDEASLGPPLQNLASVYHSQRRFAEAQELYLRALRAIEKAGRSTDRVAASIHNNLASLFGDTGEPDAGVKHAKLAVSLWESIYGGKHPQVALGLNNLAGLYCRAGRWPEAEEPIRRANTIVMDALGDRHPRREPILRTYADVMMHTGRKKEAKQMMEQATAIRLQFQRDNLVGYTVDVGQVGNLRRAGSPPPDGSK